MLIKELREKLVSSDNKIVVGNCYITTDTDADIDVFTNDTNLIVYISKSSNEDEPVNTAMTVMNETFPKCRTLALIDFLQFIGLPTNVSPITIEKEVLKLQEVTKVDVESQIEASKLRGMVDAYEKIVLGRDVTISK